MPIVSTNSRFDFLAISSISEGLINFEYWWVPTGRSLSICSAPIIAERNDLKFLLMVEKNT